jgi:hypothetical protein
MPLIKITDPKKREDLVDEYLKNKKAVQQSFLAEKLSDLNQFYELSKAFKPITNSTAALGTELKAIKDASQQQTKSLQALPSSIASQLKAIAASKLKTSDRA